MKQFNSLSEPMKIGVITAGATLVAAILGALITGFFSLKNSDGIQPTPTPIMTSTSIPPTATPTPTPSPPLAPTATPDPMATTPQQSGNKPLTCTSGTLCTTYPMTIVITTVTIASIGTSTWDFQITNTGTQPFDAYVYGYIDFGEFHVYGGEVHIPPNGTQTVSITFPAYAPTPGTLQTPELKFEILPQVPEVYYSQNCTYQAGQNTCQS